MQKITPFLWFDGNAEEAMNLYVSVFKNSKIVNVRRYGDAGPGPKGTVMTGANGVMQAMLQMDKIDIKKLKQAYDQG
jgi:predicted 3-demethylubiquinone-9 3-methyltransferase (glyoxalase superfamily)